MRFYTQQHPHYCGIDLHARTMYLCILNQAGAILLHRNMKAEPDSFLKAIAPFRQDIVIAVECIFTWYWLADLCAREKISFVLGHALYMKAIHGGKAKNDRIDAHKIAVLLRGGMIPEAYVYPEGMRSTRDLLRRRMHLMRQRAELARALAGHVDILLLDEPFSSLDYLTRLRMREEFVGLLHERPRTVILVTHDVSEAVQLADRVLVLSGRPGGIRCELQVESPRPRELTQPEVVRATHRILTELGLEHDAAGNSPYEI